MNFIDYVRICFFLDKRCTIWKLRKNITHIRLCSILVIFERALGGLPLLETSLHKQCILNVGEDETKERTMKQSNKN